MPDSATEDLWRKVLGDDYESQGFVYNRATYADSQSEGSGEGQSANDDNASENSTKEDPDAIALEPLAEALNEQQSASVFSCSGLFEAKAVDAVSLCWWGGNRRDSEKVNMARLSGGVTSSQASYPPLKALVSSCQPATFGHNSKDVFDETYRKAGKLDLDRFMTDLNPYKLGIIDTIQKMLSPNDVGIRAELYNLNVYSKGGLFRPHMDTPRGETQIGSLVVCLPVKFAGGAFAVRHSGNEELAEWADKSATHIQWTAFYSDCEHEVMPVTSGCRVTLTYNLFSADQEKPWQALPVFSSSAAVAQVEKCLADILADPQFMPDGGRLGIHTAHSYAHAASDTSPKKVIGSLKGADLALQSLFRRSEIAFDVFAATQVDFHCKPYYRGEDARLEKYRDAVSADNSKDARKVRKYQKEGGIVVGQIRPAADLSYVEYEEDDTQEEVVELFPGELAQDIFWLNQQRKDLLDTQLSYPAYGNVVSLEHEYTSLAFIVQVPSWAERSKSH